MWCIYNYVSRFFDLGNTTGMAGTLLLLLCLATQKIIPLRKQIVEKTVCCNVKSACYKRVWNHLPQPAGD